jgi:hypothetical protein
MACRKRRNSDGAQQAIGRVGKTILRMMMGEEIL